MGYYLQGPNHGKARFLAAQFDGKVLDTAPASYSDVPEDKGLVIVCDNGLFEAAGFAYDEREFAAFTDPGDTRPKQYVLLDRRVAEVQSGYRH